jgi:hypothetical protein
MTFAHVRFARKKRKEKKRKDYAIQKFKEAWVEETGQHAAKAASAPLPWHGQGKQREVRTRLSRNCNNAHQP